ncbi:MAG: C-GCAxxG-C-C family protein, partial [Thermodesulfobacteriota bacterium]
AAEIAVLAKKAFDLGYKYEIDYKGCGQCALGAIQDALGLRDDAVFKAATGLAGGVGLMGDCGCGAYLGGVMALSSFLGRTKDAFADPDKVRFKSFALARKLHERFLEEYGTVNCHAIHLNVFGRPFFLWDDDERVKFDQAGGHSTKCPQVVGLGAKWVVELLAQEGLI